jgi:hypothetical protein
VTADVLASIDGALAAYGTVLRGDVGCSMRWRPGLVICDEGEALWPALRKAPRETRRIRVPERPVFTVTGHYRTRYGIDACVRVTVHSEAARAEAERRMASARHPYPGWSPRPASQCSDCNPRGNPEPLAVDGRAYQRRLKNRRRRR